LCGSAGCFSPFGAAYEEIQPLLKLNTVLTCLISLKVSEEVSIARLLNRGHTSGRTDDNEQVIRNRLREYDEKTLPVLSFYKDRGICMDVDGSVGIDEVTAAITKLELSKNLLNIVLLGYPGSGRGSQGKALAKQYGLEYVATGSMLDREIKGKTETGRKIIEMYENGQLVPDEIVVQLIEKRLAASKNADTKGFIFKTFPRTLVQSYILDGLLKKYGTSISTIIEIEVPMLELINRLDQRSKTDRCMPYDTSTQKIVKRLQEHETKTVPMIAKYNQLHGVVKVNGEGTLEEVYKRISFEIENGFKNLR
jgi:adenylate kinase